MFLCIEELTRHEVGKSASSVLPCCHCIKSVTNGHFVSRDLFIYYLNGNQNKETWFGWFLFISSFIGSFHQWYCFSGNLMVINNIIVFSVVFIQRYAYQSHYSGLCIFGKIFLKCYYKSLSGFKGKALYS